MRTFKLSLLASVAFVSGTSGALAQEADDKDKDDAIIVTGTRIRGTVDTVTSAPGNVVSADSLSERGYVQATDLFREIPAIGPAVGIVSGGGTANAYGSNTQLSGGIGTSTNGQAGVGADYANLFKLGVSRTLTLLNGHRFISTATGLGDEAVDVNILPTGLLERVNVVQGGGSAVYGSGAIGGVVDFILKRNFSGIELDAQQSISTRGDYPVRNLRLTAGTNFAEGRGNIAIDLNWYKTGSLLIRDRYDATSTIPVPNPAACATAVPRTCSANVFLYGAHIYPDTSLNGTISTIPFNFTAAAGFAGRFLIGGNPVRFNSDGTAIETFNGGTFQPNANGTLTVVGGDFDNSILPGNSLPAIASVERKTANLVAGYDLTDNIRLSTNLTYSRVSGRLPHARDYPSWFFPSLGFVPQFAALSFTKDNPYLTPTVLAELTAASPAFAGGAPLYLGKVFRSLYPKGDNSLTQTTTVKRGMVSLEGDFDFSDRELYWSASYTYSEVRQKVKGWFINEGNFRRAVNAVKNGAGQIVCAINADASTANDDAACAPINIFGQVPISDAAAKYVLVQSGSNIGGTIMPAFNKEHNALLTLGGDVVSLPAGKAKFSVSYEYRKDAGSITPLPADAAGLTYSGVPINSAAGGFHTNEFAGEVQIPILDDGFNLPVFFKKLDVSASYRHVKHSIVGSDKVWAFGGNLTVYDGVRLRGTYARNFRAPNLTQLVLPPTVAPGLNPNVCGPQDIIRGPNPTQRAANCLALFTANPLFGTINSPVGSSAAVRLANFVPDNTSAAKLITTSGNPDLENERATTKSFGIVLTPAFIPNLVITADRIDVRMKNAITNFTQQQFQAACFDSAPGTAQEFCDTITYYPEGNIKTAIATVVNAQQMRMKADNFVVNYRFPLSAILGEGDKGNLSISLSATHTRKFETIVNFVPNRIDDTLDLPEWQGTLNLRYSKGPFALNYSAFYLSRGRINATANELNSTSGIYWVKSLMTHDLSANLDVTEKLSLRAGVNNIGNKTPDYIPNSQGGIIGRTVFVGLKARY